MKPKAYLESDLVDLLRSIMKHKDIGGITDIEVGPDSYLYILHSVKHKGRYIELFLIDYNY
jgi:hypothetical protein